jgi:glycosyl transferase family 25
MDKSKQRWINMLKYGKNNNIKINRFPAYDGNLLNQDKLISNGELLINHKLRLGQIGCAYSHLKLWEKCLKSKNKIQIVLEDDILLDKNFKNDIKFILKNTPQDWDIIFIGGCHIKGRIINKYFIKPTELSGRYNLCMHAYILNKKKIHKLINTMVPIIKSIDVQLRSHFDRLNIYYFYKNIVKQNQDIKSTIGYKNGVHYWDNTYDIILI